MSRSKEPSEGILIAARGEGTRIRRAMTQRGYAEHFPKHLLPTGGPNDETLLGRIVRQAAEAPVDVPPIIHANQYSAKHMIGHPDIDPAVEVRVAPMSPDSMDLYTTTLLRTRQRVMGSAGDYYASYQWQRMLDFHDSQPRPVTFLVGRTPVAEPVAAFDVADSGRIREMRRKPEAESEDLVSVGVYIFDPSRKALEIMEDLVRKRAGEEGDPLGTRLIESGLVSAYVVETPVFNINTIESLEALNHYTAEEAQRV